MGTDRGDALGVGAVLAVLAVAAAHVTRARVPTRGTDAAVQLLAVACMAYACGTAGAPYGGRYVAWAIAGPPVVCAVLGSVYETIAAAAGRTGKM